MCQEADENNPLIQKILEVLYATEVSNVSSGYQFSRSQHVQNKVLKLCFKLN